MTMPPRRGQRVDLGAVGAVIPIPAEQAPLPPAPAPVDTMAEATTGEPGEYSYDNLVFPGEALTVSTTLAVILPGDEKESYFGAKHVAIVQPGEEYPEVATRSKIVVNNTVRDTIADCIDMIAESLTPAPPA